MYARATAKLPLKTPAMNLAAKAISNVLARPNIAKNRKDWLVFSSILDLIVKEKKQFDEADFAITNISHSRTIIELEGNLVNEVLKKGCPLDVNTFKEGDCANSVYNGITVTIDFVSDNPKKVRISGLRSFGESLHHSITDSCLEFGYKSIVSSAPSYKKRLGHFFYFCSI